MSLVLLKSVFLLAVILGAIRRALGIAAREDPAKPPSSSRRFLRVATAVGAVGALMAAFDLAVIVPLYGGYVDFVMGEFVASSTMKGLMGRIGGVRSAISIYYGDTEGQYPASLDALWRDRKYLPASPGHADVFTMTQGGVYSRVHWRYKTDDIKNFSSREQADDGGGWGYVNDPRSPQWGAVFVNCTHSHWKTGLPWNLSTEAVSGRPTLPAPVVPIKPPAVPSAPPKVSIRPNLIRILIPGGSFMMGSDNLGPDERPAHRVIIKSFYLAKTEVTNGQYRTCVEAGACAAPSAYQGGDEHPVVNVDWEQARAFSQWVGGRLPTEAEWEYAARGAGRDYKFPWGNENADCARAVMRGDGSVCGGNSSWPVCSKPAGNSPQGLCDMEGNVSEWTQDWHHISYVGAPNDGSAWLTPAGSQRVIRGGSWYSGLEDGSVSRWVGQRGVGLGFRPAWSR